MIARRTTALGLTLALTALSVGCARCAGPSGRDGGVAPRDVGTSGDEGVLGDIRRAARFSAAPATLAIPGVRTGLPFVAIVVAVPSGARERPGDEGDTFEIACFLGRARLTRLPRPELTDAVLLVGPESNEDWRSEPVWCTRRSRVPATKSATNTLDAEYQAARQRRAPARWVRGKDAPQTIIVPPWRSGDPLPDPIGSWLGKAEERSP